MISKAPDEDTPSAGTTAGERQPQPESPSEFESYTPERRAEFLINNAVDAKEWDQAIAEARAMGVDPDAVPHQDRPAS
jgi:hypothetical protein